MAAALTPLICESPIAVKYYLVKFVPLKVKRVYNVPILFPFLISRILTMTGFGGPVDLVSAVHLVHNE